MDFEESASLAFFSEHVYEQHLHLASRSMTMAKSGGVSFICFVKNYYARVCLHCQIAMLDNELAHPRNHMVPTFAQ